MDQGRTERELFFPFSLRRCVGRNVWDTSGCRKSTPKHPFTMMSVVSPVGDEVPLSHVVVPGIVADGSCIYGLFCRHDAQYCLPVVDYERIWTDRNTGCPRDGAAWLPRAPHPEYCAPGVAFTSSHHTPPEAGTIFAVHRSFLEPFAESSLVRFLGDDRGTSAAEDACFFESFPGVTVISTNYELSGIRAELVQPAPHGVARMYASIADRRLNHHCWIMTHNSTSLARAGNPVANQNVSLEVQLQHGVRGLKLPITFTCDGLSSELKRLLFKRHRQSAERTAFVAHSGGRSHLVDRTSVRLSTVLAGVRSFLLSRPGDVLLLVLNLMADRKYVSLDRACQMLKEAFVEAELWDRVFEKDATVAAWPTMSELAQAGKNVVVMIDDPPGTSDPEFRRFLYTKNTLVETEYHFKSDNIHGMVLDTSLRTSYDVPFLESGVFMIHHYITGVLSGRLEYARVTNTFQNILIRSLLLLSTYGKCPVILQLDFFGCGAEIAAVSYLNKIWAGRHP